MNPTAATYIRARIDADTKAQAAHVLAGMGISFTDAIRVFMSHIAEKKCFPYTLKIPNATTRRAIAELEAGGGQHFTSVDEMMAVLNADD